ASSLARSRSFTTRYEQGIAHSTAVNGHTKNSTCYLTGALGHHHPPPEARTHPDLAAPRTRRGLISGASERGDSPGGGAGRGFCYRSSPKRRSYGISLNAR